MKRNNKRKEVFFMFDIIVTFVLFFLSLGMGIGFYLTIPNLIRDKKFKKDLVKIAKAFVGIIILLAPGGLLVAAIYTVYFKKPSRR